MSGGQSVSQSGCQVDCQDIRAMYKYKAFNLPTVQPSHLIKYAGGGGGFYCKLDIRNFKRSLTEF